MRVKHFIQEHNTKSLVRAQILHNRSNHEATMPPCFNKLMSSVGILTIIDILKYLLNVFGWLSAIVLPSAVLHQPIIIINIIVL